MPSRRARRLPEGERAVRQAQGQLGHGAVSGPAPADRARHRALSEDGAAAGRDGAAAVEDPAVGGGGVIGQCDCHSRCSACGR